MCRVFHGKAVKEGASVPVVSGRYKRALLDTELMGKMIIIQSFPVINMAKKLFLVHYSHHIAGASGVQLK